MSSQLITRLTRRIKMDKLMAKLMPKKGENFSSPALYPITSIQDNGGCFDKDGCGAYCAKPVQLTPDQMYNSRCARRRVEERQGNNTFDEMGDRSGFVTGVGCMNPDCMCPGCEGDCVCGRKSIEGFSGFLADKDWKFWLVVIIVAYFMYMYLKKKGGSRRR